MGNPSLYFHFENKSSIYQVIRTGLENHSYFIVDIITQAVLFANTGTPPYPNLGVPNRQPVNPIQLLSTVSCSLPMYHGYMLGELYRRVEEMVLLITRYLSTTMLN